MLKADLTVYSVVCQGRFNCMIGDTMHCSITVL